MKKRYSATDAEELLGEVVAFAEAGDEVSISRGRAVLSTLVAARLGDVIVGKEARAELSHWTDVQVRARQRTLAQFFRMFLIPIAFQVEMSKLRIGAVRGATDDVALMIDGAARDVLTFQTASLLRAAGVQRLRRCECGRVFARVGKRKYCTDQCQKRFYMRRYRTGDAGKEQ
jgi:hypothetical protein